MGHPWDLERSTENPRQQVGVSNIFKDKDYEALARRFDDERLQLQLVLRDVEEYIKEAENSMARFNELITAMEGIAEVVQSNYSDWRASGASSRGRFGGSPPKPYRNTTMRKRDKWLLDYERFKVVGAQAGKTDKEIAEEGEQSVALNKTLKNELARLNGLTAQLAEACLKNLVQFQTTWYSMLQTKIRAHAESFPDDFQKIISNWSSGYASSEAQILPLGICNGALLADIVHLANPEISSTWDFLGKFDPAGYETQGSSLIECLFYPNLESLSGFKWTGADPLPNSTHASDISLYISALLFPKEVHRIEFRFLMLQRAKKLPPTFDQYRTTHQYLQFKLEEEECRQIDYLLFTSRPLIDNSNASGFPGRSSCSKHSQQHAPSCQSITQLQKSRDTGGFYGMATTLAPSKKLRFFTTKDWQGHDYAKQYRKCLEEGFKRYKQELSKENTPATVGALTDSPGLNNVIETLLDPQTSLLPESDEDDDDEIARYLAKEPQGLILPTLEPFGESMNMSSRYLLTSPATSSLFLQVALVRSVFLIVPVISASIAGHG
ncbi:guanine nucleotide exchange factor 9 [Penicillium rubens]|nr:guanine nucleotide exchange factor 9 [Penicillium rubens]